MAERAVARAALIAVAIAAAATACADRAGPDDASSTRDAGADAAPTGAPTVAIEGPAFAFVGEDACFTARTTEPAGSLTFVWGDGETTEAGVDAPEACHAWAYPGPLVIGVALAARGMRAEATALVSVVFEPSSPRPTASSSIAYDAARDRVWVVEPDSGVVAVIDAVARTRIGVVTVGERPRTVAISGDAALVACQGDGTVHVIDAASLAPRGVVPLGAGSAPFAVAADPRGGRAWVTLQARGELAAIDVATRAVGAVLDVGRDPRGLAVRADGTIAVTRWRARQDATSIAIVDARDPSAPVRVGDTALPAETGVDSDTDNNGVLSFVSAIAPSPDGGRVLLAALKANTVSGDYRGDRPLTSQTTARAALAEVSLGAAGAPGRDTFRYPYDDLDYASAAIFSPMGERLYVAMQGAEVVIASDAFSFDTVGSVDDVGHAPIGLAIDPGGRWLFVHAFLSRAVRVYDVSDLSRDPDVAAEIAIVDDEPLPDEVLAGKILFHRSRDPRMSRTRYLSCASCHMDGDGDGLVWDFTQRGEGLRNTIPLAGRGGVAHGPLHWSANFDEVQDFEHDIRGGQGGTGFLADDAFHTGTRDTTLGDPKAGLSPELDALAAYVASLDRFGTSPHRSVADAAWEASRARGEALFRDAAIGCAACHAGARYTDSALVSAGAPVLHDVGTIGPGSGGRLGGALAGLDTPTLRGLWSSAPYLHDGSAATLREVLRDRNPDDRHGATSGLDDAALSDLETFLLSLDDHAP